MNKRAGMAYIAVTVAWIWVMNGGGSLLADETHDREDGRGAFTFALIGDMPYGAEGEAKFPNVIADINADPQLAFVVHDGDIKNGSSLCSDEMYYNRLDSFNRFRQPFVYVPGDNEWTDCHRANNGAYDPLERLAFLRSVFYSTERSLGRQTMKLERQSQGPDFPAYRENVRWTMHDVLFVGLHVVGSNNNRGRTPEADAEYAARNAANIAWLGESFAHARTHRARAVMIVIQANPNFDLPPSAPQRSGFNDFLALLESETLNFGKPVVLVHGDSHYFRMDKPMLGTRSGRRIEQFTRLETFGENDNHWVKVTVEPGNPAVFTFQQRIVVANLVQH
jgi:calcineurin-like phosphoesterase family protein